MAFSGVNHLALSTNDMKAQIEFFTQVVGMELTALFPMHGAEGASHCFLKAGKDCYLSFIQMQGVVIEPMIGVSHARDVLAPVAGGAMQHISFNVETMSELLDLRDRLRGNGCAVFGPLDHGTCKSMYLGAPEGIVLEFATCDGSPDMDPKVWVDPATGAVLGMTADDLARYVSPPAIAGQAGSLPQPDLETSVYPPPPIPRPMFEALGQLNDEELSKALSFPTPTGSPANTAH